MKLNKKLVLIMLIVIGLTTGYFLYKNQVITIPPCHVLKEVSTYSQSIDEESAKTIVLNYLGTKGLSISANDLDAQKLDGGIKVFVSLNITSKSLLCNTYEKEPKCIGQWYELKNGKLYEEYINPC